MRCLVRETYHRLATTGVFDPGAVAVHGHRNDRLESSFPKELLRSSRTLAVIISASNVDWAVSALHLEPASDNLSDQGKYELCV